MFIIRRFNSSRLFWRLTVFLIVLFISFISYKNAINTEKNNIIAINGKISALKLKAKIPTGFLINTNQIKKLDNLTRYLNVVQKNKILSDFKFSMRTTSKGLLKKFDIIIKFSGSLKNTVHYLTLLDAVLKKSIYYKSFKIKNRDFPVLRTYLSFYFYLRA